MRFQSLLIVSLLVTAFDLASDGLHLEKPAYEGWAVALRPVVTEILGPAAATDKAPGPTGVLSKTDP